jgi:cell division protein FtsB
LVFLIYNKKRADKQIEKADLRGEKSLATLDHNESRGGKLLTKLDHNESDSEDDMNEIANAAVTKFFHDIAKMEAMKKNQPRGQIIVAGGGNDELKEEIRKLKSLQDMLHFRIESLGKSVEGINGEIKDVKDTVDKKLDEKINVSTTKFGTKIKEETVTLTDKIKERVTLSDKIKEETNKIKEETAKLEEKTKTIQSWCFTIFIILLLLLVYLYFD